MKKIKLSKKQYLIVAAIALFLVAGSVAAYSYFSNKNSGETVNDGTNLDSPTEEEQTAGDRQKEIIEEQEKERQKAQNSDQQKTATVIITDAGQYDDIIEVRSFIPDHYENGTCAITFSKGSQTVTKQTPAYRDASTTICTNPLFKRSEFPSAGDWQVSVSYSSAGATGKSKQQTITIE